jgi:hypothetical protein
MARRINRAIVSFANLRWQQWFLRRNTCVATTSGTRIFHFGYRQNQKQKEASWVPAKEKRGTRSSYENTDRQRIITDDFPDFSNTGRHS